MSVFRNWFLVLVGLFVGVVVLWNITEWLRNDKGCLVVSGQCVASLEVVDDDKSRALGLSGRESLTSDSGMLFVFDSPDYQCFWMKDMKFPLDIVWLNSDKQVVYLQENVSPDSYPHNFCSDDLSQYVIELNAGQAREFGITLGQTLEF